MVATRYSFGKECLDGAFGRYDKSLEGESPTDARAALQALVDRHQALELLHARSIGNDGRIIGTERSRLLEGLDGLVLAAVAVFRKLAGGAAINFAEDPSVDQPVSMVFDLDGWILRGRIPLVKGGFKASFMEYHRKELSPALRAFLEAYRADAADALLSDGEKASLIRELRTVFLSAIEFYSLVYHVRINA